MNLHTLCTSYNLTLTFIVIPQQSLMHKLHSHSTQSPCCEAFSDVFHIYKYKSATVKQLINPYLTHTHTPKPLWILLIPLMIRHSFSCNQSSQSEAQIWSSSNNSTAWIWFKLESGWCSVTHRTGHGSVGGACSPWATWGPASGLSLFSVLACSAVLRASCLLSVLVLYVLRAPLLFQ